VACDVGEWTYPKCFIFASMAESQKAPVKRGGRYCVRGGPGGVICKNSTHTPGIIMHNFPSDKTRSDERRLWTKFVRRHRVNFSPTQ
jgi:hypothetical protein